MENPPEIREAVRPRPKWRRACRTAVSGFLFGTLLGLGVSFLVNGLLPITDEYLVPLGALTGALVAQTRARNILKILTATVIGIVAIIGYTPLVPFLLRGLAYRDPLRPAAAVVVLASSVYNDGSLTPHAQARILHGYEVLRQGYAPRLVLTRGPSGLPSWIPTVRRQMKDLRLDYPIDDVGAVENTHDEALRVARLARERGWSSVILVTDPLHMRRAVRVFERSGIQVVASPCATLDYLSDHPGRLLPRLQAFREWLHEVIGLQVYRMRGWI